MNAPLRLPCPTCSGTRSTTTGDRHADTNMDVCATCHDEGWIPARTGETSEASFRWSGFYIASKTAHAARWKALRAAGVPIISTWIDEAGVGESSDLGDLWRRCIGEAAGATCLVVYREPGEVLKGAFVEVGAALAAGRKVYAVGMDDLTVAHHAGVVRCASLDEAILAASLEVAQAPWPIAGSRSPSPLPRILEAPSAMPSEGYDWHLTCEWPDGLETIERVTDRGARALGLDVERLVAGEAA